MLELTHVVAELVMQMRSENQAAGDSECLTGDVQGSEERPRVSVRTAPFHIVEAMGMHSSQ